MERTFVKEGVEVEGRDESRRIEVEAETGNR